MSKKLPLIIEPSDLAPLLGQKNILIIDITKPNLYNQQHIPGALFLDYSRVVKHMPPVMGLLPTEEEFSQLLGSIGLTPQTHVIAYDEEGGGKAGRFLWTLEAAGHNNFSMLNGGLIAWANEGNPLDSTPEFATPTEYHFDSYQEGPIGSRDHLREVVGTPGTVFVDARTLGEYTGTDKRAERAGHIPGAVNIDWMTLIDQSNNARLLPEPQLRQLFEEAGVTPNKEIIVYCHSHHRSALSYMALKSLGYERVKGYPGSWSDWGNCPGTPIES